MTGGWNYMGVQREEKEKAESRGRDVRKKDKEEEELWFV